MPPKMAYKTQLTTTNRRKHSTYNRVSNINQAATIKHFTLMSEQHYMKAPQTTICQNQHMG